jgi:hypothetical protein
LRNRIRDHLQHAIDIRMHVVVPESQDTKILPPEPSVTNRIILRRMLAPVDLDNQPRLQTNEIGDVAPERHLTPERCTVESMGSQPIPKLALGIRHIAA